MTVTSEQIIEKLVQTIDQYHQALLVHDAETAKDIQMQVDEIYAQYVEQ